jgi:hypothetical protein
MPKEVTLPPTFFVNSPPRKEERSLPKAKVAAKKPMKAQPLLREVKALPTLRSLELVVPKKTIKSKEYGPIALTCSFLT